MVHQAGQAGGVGLKLAFHLLQRPLMRFVIDRQPVVGIDQTEVPHLRTLVDIRHAGDGQFQQRLGNAVDRTPSFATGAWNGTNASRNGLRRDTSRHS